MTEIQQIKVGGLYSTGSPESGFGLVKILALDPGVVSLRIYGRRSTNRPSPADISVMKSGSPDEPKSFGIGHVPVAEAQFISWSPEFLAEEPVSEEELEGYHFWKEDLEGGHGAAGH